MDPAPGSPTRSTDFPSHAYRFDRQDLARNLAMTVGLVLMAGLTALGLLRSGLGGKPALLGDADATILATKARIASEPSEARVAFVGDSSCLINVDIPTLRAAGIEAVNLGTLSYLGLDAFGLLARRFCEGRSRAEVVLVVHPECLRLAQPSADHRRILETALGLGESAWSFHSGSVAEALGFEELRSRWLDRAWPTPLRGGLGARYGFTRDLGRELFDHGGTLEETAQYEPGRSRDSAEYRIAPRIRPECERFRKLLPPGTRLRLVVSPVPQSHALRRHEATVSEMSATVAASLGAEGLRDPMPSILPDADFGTTTHLRPEAARRYTQRLAEALK